MVSVVVPAHNAASTIRDCIEALHSQTRPDLLHEVIVVDNNSTDATATIAKNAGAIVIHESQPGPAAARNAGTRLATGQIIAFTDADCRPLPNWVEMVSTQLREDSETIGCKGVYLTEQSSPIARFVQIEYEDKYDLLRPQATIDFIDTYSAAYRRDILLANNGFDENFLFLEDQELSFRLAARGYKMRFQPEAIVYHHHSDTLQAYFRKKFFIAYWKAQVVSRFPNRGVRDSHTPQVMKIQMALIMLTISAVIGLITIPILNRLLPAISWEWLAAAPLLGIAAFTATTFPFVRKAWPKDQTIAFLSPLLLAVRATALSFGYIWGTLRPDNQVSDEQATTIGGLNFLIKRAIDIFGSIVGLTFTLIFGPFIAIAIKLDSSGPAIFKQERIGQEGRPFTIYKFRSMRQSAEQELDQLIDLENLADPAFKLDDDPRITKVGRFLRRWSLDELPQFWNVLRGEMSLIGPRPEESRIVAKYEDWHRKRLAVKPGISGPMQVNGRGDLSFNERIRLELEYIEHYTVWRDIKLLARTFPSVVGGKGAR